MHGTGSAPDRRLAPASRPTGAAWRRRRRLAVAGSLAVFAALAVAATVAVTWVWADRRMHPPPGASEHELSDFPALEAEEVSFTSRTGVRLSGRFFAGDRGATIILTHGHGGTQDEMLPVADALRSVGFNVLTYDSRGSGRSEGTPTFGDLERDDLRSAVDFAISRTDVDPDRIGVLGFSVGGSAAIMAAAEDPRIKAVVDDSGWSDVDNWIGRGARRTFRDLRPISAIALRMLELRSGVQMDDLRPAAVIGRISPRPVLLVHGTSDALILPSNAHQNLAAAGPGSELWLVPGAAHGDTIALRDGRYAERVSAFFEHALEQ